MVSIPMNKQRRSLMELPKELKIEIFLKLPVRCLMICQCVCKHFYNLIQTPFFVNTHISNIRSTTSTSESLMLEYVDQDDETLRSFTHHLLLSINSSSRNVRSSSLNPQIPYVGALFVVGSCNGLICFEVCIDCLLDDIYLLWNPVTRQTRYLPKPETNICSYFPTVEFGFVQETNEYIVARLGCIRRLNCVCEVQLYKMNTDSWTTIYCNMVDGVELKTYSDLRRQDTPVFLNGSFHWTFGFAHYIVSFNLRNEELRLIRSLDCDRVPSGHGGKLAVVEELLAMIYYKHLHNSFQIWVMTDYGGVQDSWVLRFQTSNNISRWLYPVGYYKTDLMIIALKNLLYLFDLNTENCKKIPELDCHLRGFYSFVQTLAPVSVTRNYSENLARALENSLSDVDSVEASSNSTNSNVVAGSSKG